MALSHNCCTMPAAWETQRRLRPELRNSCTFWKHFSWKAVSPTARISSTSRTSGSHIDGHREGQAHHHACRVGAQRFVDELVLNAGEVDDLVEEVADAFAAQAQQRACGNGWANGLVCATNVMLAA